MKLEPKIRQMKYSQRGQELQRIRNLARSFAKREDNSKCWHEEELLVRRILGERIRIGRMTKPKNELLAMCSRYIDRQKCTSAKCAIRLSRRRLK